MGLVASLPDSLDGLRGVLRPWLAVLIAVSLLLAANAVVGGSARILYSLARHHQVPAALGRVHATRMTPYVGIVLFGLVAAVLLIPDDPLLLLGLFGFGAALAFTLANASIVALRYREPAISRPFVIPFNVRVPRRPAARPRRRRRRGDGCRLGPHGGHPRRRRGRRLRLARRRPGAVRRPPAQRRLRTAHASRGRRLCRPRPSRTSTTTGSWCPSSGTRLSDEMMVLGCQLAADKDAVIDVLYVLEVPMNLPLDASLPEGRARGKHVLDTAMAVAREFGVEAWPHLVSARSPGRAIVDTAREWDADVIIMGAVRRHRADGRLVGDTVAHVMRQGARGSAAQPRRRGLPDAGVRGPVRRRAGRGEAPDGSPAAAGTGVRRAMHVIIAGCGRVGSGMAMDLVHEGHDVVVIDEDPRTFALLGDELPVRARSSARPSTGPSCAARASRARTPSPRPPTATTPTSSAR